MGPSAAPTAMKEHRDAVEATAAVVLPRHCGGRGGECCRSSESDFALPGGRGECLEAGGELWGLQAAEGMGWICLERRNCEGR